MTIDTFIQFFKHFQSKSWQNKWRSVSDFLGSHSLTHLIFLHWHHEITTTLIWPSLLLFLLCGAAAFKPSTLQLTEKYARIKVCCSFLLWLMREMITFSISNRKETFIQALFFSSILELNTKFKRGLRPMVLSMKAWRNTSVLSTQLHAASYLCLYKHAQTQSRHFLFNHSFLPLRRM